MKPWNFDDFNYKNEIVNEPHFMDEISWMNFITP